MSYPNMKPEMEAKKVSPITKGGIFLLKFKMAEQSSSSFNTLMPSLGEDVKEEESTESGTAWNTNSEDGSDWNSNVSTLSKAFNLSLTSEHVSSFFIFF